MLNPFKKKDNSFRLDDISLPSLNEEPSQPSEMPSLDSHPEVPSMPELPSLETPINSQSQEQFPNLTQNDFGTPAMGTNSNPMLSTPNTEIQPQQVNNSNHSEIAKAQLETIMSKINLMDARQQNMEQKLEMIYQIILNEVSEDTRRKLNIDSMMKKIKY